MVKQMAARTIVQIKKSERRLENLRNVNKAAEEYVQDKYGMDIFRFSLRIQCLWRLSTNPFLLTCFYDCVNLLDVS